MRASLVVFVALALATSGCDLLFPPDEPDDLDNDGYDETVDCDDLSSATYPGAGEICDSADNDCDGTVDEGFDEDADGFNTCGADQDCNDIDASVFPGADEICDGADNNCDGEIDEGCEVDVDNDNDGHLASVDCNDSNALVYPGAPETCNGIDDNCDDVVDEGFDDDGDGWSGCNGVDCNDDDPAIHPEAVEVCDGDDEDCDGLADEDFDLDGDGWTTCKVQPDCDDNVASTHPYAPEQCNGVDVDCDGLGDEDTDGDGDGVSACAGDCDDTDPDIYPGAVELPNGVDDDCSGAADDGYSGQMSASLFVPTVTGSETQERLGDVLSSGGHYNADPYGDVLSGSGSYNSGQGRAHLILGESFSTASPPAAVAPFATVTGTTSGEYLGWSVDQGDLNDDGYDDLIIGAPEFNTASPPNGSVYVFFGSAAVTGGTWPPGAADVHLEGSLSTEQCGTAVAALGDVNGDGVGDLGFTCPWYDSGGGILRGRTIVVYGAATWPSEVTADAGDVRLVGADADIESGQALAGSDVNGDGFADIAIGSPNYDGGRGRVVLFAGSGSLSGSLTFNSALRSWIGDGGDGVGEFLLGGDADGDAYGDLLIGAPGVASDTGRLGLLRGAASPPASAVAWSAVQLYVSGSATTEQAGFSGALGDIDGDGIPDLLASTPGWDGSGGGDQGTLQMFYGPLTSYSGMVSSSSADAFVVGAAGGDFLGGAVGVVPDFNGDGADDVLVASPFSDAGGGNAGRIYFVPGF